MRGSVAKWSVVIEWLQGNARNFNYVAPIYPVVLTREATHPAVTSMGIW